VLSVKVVPHAGAGGFLTSSSVVRWPLALLEEFLATAENKPNRFRLFKPTKFYEGFKQKP